MGEVPARRVVNTLSQKFAVFGMPVSCGDHTENIALTSLSALLSLRLMEIDDVKRKCTVP